MPLIPLQDQPITAKQLDYIDRLNNTIFGGEDFRLKGHAYAMQFLKKKFGKMSDLSKADACRLIDQLLYLRDEMKVRFGSGRKVED